MEAQHYSPHHLRVVASLNEHDVAVYVERQTGDALGNPCWFPLHSKNTKMDDGTFVMLTGLRRMYQELQAKEQRIAELQKMVEQLPKSQPTTTTTPPTGDQDPR